MSGQQLAMNQMRRLRWSTGGRSATGLKALLDAAKLRVLDAKAIPWPALAESWQRDVELLERAIAEGHDAG